MLKVIRICIDLLFLLGAGLLLFVAFRISLNFGLAVLGALLIFFAFLLCSYLMDAERKGHRGGGAV